MGVSVELRLGHERAAVLGDTGVGKVMLTGRLGTLGDVLFVEGTCVASTGIAGKVAYSVLKLKREDNEK